MGHPVYRHVKIDFVAMNKPDIRVNVYGKYILQKGFVNYHFLNKSRRTKFSKI